MLSAFDFRDLFEQPVFILNNKNNNQEHHVTVDICLEQSFMSLEWIVQENWVFDKHDSNQDRKLVFDTFVIESYLFWIDQDKEKPCKACKTSHLENLWRISLSQSNFLIW